MRTVKRYSLRVNQAKWLELEKVAGLYRAEKNVHLKHFNIDKNYATDKSHLEQQMRCVKGKYASPNVLQARQ